MSARSAAVIVTALALVGLISAQPGARTGNAPTQASATVFEVQYVTAEECRTSWPAATWPQASVCSDSAVPTSPRVSVSAAPGGPRYRFTPPPRGAAGNAAARTLRVGPRAVVTYLTDGDVSARLEYE